MPLSPQQLSLLIILQSKNKALTVQQLSQELKIVPNSIYRLLDPLLEWNIISKHDGWPATFSVGSQSEMMSMFLLHQADWFQNQISTPRNSSQKNTKKPKHAEDISLSFVQSRNTLMELSETEIDTSRTSIDLLRSGHEIPSEVLRALHSAIARKVRVRMLIQDHEKHNQTQVKNWMKNGIHVRKIHFTKLRLMIFDSTTLYFMSYKHRNSKKDMGMKVTYPPFTVLLQQYFNQIWETGSEIS